MPVLRPLLRVVLLSTALSGAASFVYEIVWIRMLSMAVGSTLHAFELMLTSFIAGIAFGGLWVRKRAEPSCHLAFPRNPRRYWVAAKIWCDFPASSLCIFKQSPHIPFTNSSVNILFKTSSYFVYSRNYHNK